MENYTQGTKVWHREFGFCKFVRPLVATPEFAFVDARGCGGVMQKVRFSDLHSDAPPKMTRDEKWQLNLQATLAKIRVSPAAYYVAGWIVSHPSKFNLSYPPGQQDMVIEATMKYGVDFTDATMTESTDATAGWSCSVVTSKIDPDVRARLDRETDVKCTDYFTTDKVSLQAREFVLGFLGGELGIKLGASPTIDEVRSLVPEQFKGAFDAGINVSPLV